MFAAVWVLNNRCYQIDKNTGNMRCRVLNEPLIYDEYMTVSIYHFVHMMAVCLYVFIAKVATWTIGWKGHCYY